LISPLEKLPAQLLEKTAAKQKTRKRNTKFIPKRRFSQVAEKLKTVIGLYRIRKIVEATRNSKTGKLRDSSSSQRNILKAL
jgi:hypothetical protein